MRAVESITSTTDAMRLGGGMVAKTTISRFWNWFTNYSREMERLLESGRGTELRDLVEPQVCSLGANLGWEVGPGIERKYASASH